MSGGGLSSAEPLFAGIAISKAFAAVVFDDGHILPVKRSDIHFNHDGRLCAFWGKGANRKSCELTRKPSSRDFWEGKRFYPVEVHEEL